MDQPNLKQQLRAKGKRVPIDAELRELRGTAVEIKEPPKPGDPVRQIVEIIDNSDSSAMNTGMLPSITGQGSLQQTFGKNTMYANSQYGNQGMMAFNSDDQGRKPTPYGTLQQYKDHYDHMKSYHGQFGTVSPRFTAIVRNVGEFISLQERINQDFTETQQQKHQVHQNPNFNRHMQVQRGSIHAATGQDPFETINETATATMSITDDYGPASRGMHSNAFVTMSPMQAEIEAHGGIRNGRVQRSQIGRNTHSSQSRTQQTLQPSDSSQAKHMRRVSQEQSRNRRGQFATLGHPKLPQYAQGDHENQALQQNNSNTRRFQNFMGKVISSVRQRTHASKLGDSSDQQMPITTMALAIPESQNDFTLTRPGLGGQSNNMMLSGQSALNQVVASEQHLIAQSLTPANILASARREIGASEGQNSSDAKMNRSSQFIPVGGKTSTQSNLQMVLAAQSNQQPRAAEQVAYLLKQVQRNKDKVFIPLEAYSASTRATTKEATILKESKHPDRVEPGNYVFSQQGFVKLGTKENPMTDYISKEKYIQDGVDFMIISKVPFFKNFLAMKTLKQWRYKVRARCYERNRQRLAQNFIFARPIFAKCFKPIVERTNRARFLKFLEIKPDTTYGKMQQCNLDQRCEQCCKESKAELAKLLTQVKGILTDLKQQIDSDDMSFHRAIKEAEVEKMLKNKSNHQAVVMFSKERKEAQHIKRQQSLSIDRQGLYNRLVQFISRYLSQNLVEMLFSNKQEFKDVFCNPDLNTMFEVSLCFNQTGILDSDPSMQEHKNNFELIFQSMEDSIFKNSFLSFFLQDLPELFYTNQRILVRHTAQLSMRRVVTDMESRVSEDMEYRNFGLAIENQLTEDIKKLKLKLVKYSPVQQVYDFTQEWNRGQSSRQLSLNMNFYNETFAKIKDFEAIIAEVDSKSIQLGTILMESATLKKQLTEMPQQIMNSIRHNVTSTMDNEIRLLREDLSKTSEILEQSPTSLNVYVEQTNTLKFVAQKQGEFDKKFDIIKILREQCQNDNIKIAANIDAGFMHVEGLYNGLGGLCKRAREGLNKNKESMEKIVKGSSQALSKKIKAFEKKYVENYLQDQSRLEDCSVTLEELFKRSTAIQEIKSKVMLYKEFLKLLYEDDPDAAVKLENNRLSCAEDCDFLQDVHKHTIRLWQNLLFWRKRKVMCWETPFLKLDLNMVQRSITKILTYFELKLPQNQFVHEKSVNLTRQIEKSVKETSVIVDFTKELHKDSLQHRHWVQFFTLIKAQHLKNSTTFTIIDLSEYKIQNYSQDIKLIINHAFTESRYENVFKSIRSEWEMAELRILPFKDSDKDYVIANTDILSDSIEESLGTLETLHSSDYAAHVRKEIEGLIKVLKQMLDHLDKWVQAQKYWVTIDPIYNSGLFANIFASKQRDFLETRSQFRRIMWSSYRNPNGMYNLMIKDRMKVFIKLTEYYLVVQQKTHEYLEQKRLSFNRFFFLNDSQFLDFLMLANSNQDFSVYVNILFQGAQNLFISQIKPSQHVKVLARTDTLGLDAHIEEPESESVQDSEDAESDIEAQLEAFMGQALLQQHSDPVGIQDSEDELLHIDEIKRVKMPALNVFKDRNQWDPVFQVDGGKGIAHAKKPYLGDPNKQDNGQTSAVSSELDSVTLDSDSTIKGKNKPVGIDSADSLSNSEINASDDSDEADQLVKLQQRFVLGMLSSNRELFLFDRQVKMGKNVENWLLNVEDAMRMSIKKHMKNALLRFASQPIEEWICDYPQQVSISVLHLVIAQEITDTLANVDFEAPEIQNADSRALFHESKVTISKDPVLVKALETQKSGGISARSKNSLNSKEQKDEVESQDKSQRAGPTATREKDKEETMRFEDFVLVSEKQSMEPPLEEGEAHANFLDEAFGENSNVEHYLDQAYLNMRQQENRMTSKSLQAKAKQMSKTTQPEFKKKVLDSLQYKGLSSLWLRLAFWINKCTSLLHRPKQERYDKPVMNFELLGVHKMQIKSVILFLRYLQDMVDRLFQSKVIDVNDFEWLSKMRPSWSLEDEAMMTCGDWTMPMGYEYLGTFNRTMIVPLTERYFVFVASSLREKSSVLFQCIPEQHNASQIIEEMAALCAVPFRTIHCSEHTNLASLTQLLNGVSMSQVWLFMEYMDRLPLIGLSILLKEIQLIHQQFAARQFRDAVNKEGKHITEEEDFTNILRNKPVINVGIFGSLQHTLAVKKPKICEELLRQVRTSFRTVSLQKPDLNYLFQTFLAMEHFTLPIDTANMLQRFFVAFAVIKDRELYKGKLEAPDTGGNEELSLQNMRTALKLSQLLKDQEYAAFWKKQLVKDTIDNRVVNTLDKFQVVSWLNKNSQKYHVKHKDRSMYLEERERWAVKKKFCNDTKFQIELDSLKEGFRTVVKSKVNKEWREARFTLYQKQKIAMVATLDEDMIDTQSIEAEIDKCVLEAYELVVHEMKEQGQLVNKGRDIARTGSHRGPLAGQGTQVKMPTIDDSQSLTSKAQPNRQARMLKRQGSIMSYQFSATNLTPFLRKGSKTARLKHASTVELIHNVERERKETEFRDQMHDMIMRVADELKIQINQQQIYNCLGIVETMRRFKGIVISGPQCSGKTQLMKIVTIALKRAFNVTIRSTFITPQTFSDSELYGPTQAFSRSQEIDAESNAIRKSVFDIILDSYQREKHDLRPSEANRLIQSIYVDSKEVDTTLGESISTFLRDTNTRERDYHKETEFILSFSRDSKKIQQVTVQQTPMRFPNGNVILMPSDLFFFFETHSLQNVSPVFLAQVGIVNTQNTDVTPKNLFIRQLKLVQKKHESFFKEFHVNEAHMKMCADKFVLSFMLKLNEQPLIQNWSLWNMKSLTLQFFTIFNAFLYRLEENCQLNLRNEDPMEYPFVEMQKDIIWNLMLVATTWSFGAILDKELRRTFDEQFGPYRSMFNITFSQPIKRYTVFEIFFDVERLTWALIGEKLDYKIKVHFNSDLNQCVLPTNEISQAYLMIDYVNYSLGKEKDLNKHMRLIGPQSSSKTVILNTFEKKLNPSVNTLSIPMTSYLTMERLRFKIEEKYVNKRKNVLVPADPNKKILLVIDDIHLQRNLKIEVLEFIRAWTTCRGYFDVKAGFFKKVGEFGTLMAENSEYVATSSKKDRFGFQTTSLYCEEISNESAKPFIQTWFTTDCWSTSELIKKYYILITNALDKLLKQIKRNEAIFSHSSLSKIHRFQFVSNFCYSTVMSSINSEKEDVFCIPDGQRSNVREENALADIFCYHAMRCFGDRIMRPKARSDFTSKLADICAREFLCDPQQYTPAYIDSLLLGNYHMRDSKAHIKLTNITYPSRKRPAIEIIQDKVQKQTGNQLLQTLLDIPTGINDVFRISRIYFKDGQHLAIVGLAGSGKHELMQLSGILNDVVIFELNVPCFGQPVKFVQAFKNALKSTAKLNQTCVLQISETQLRDPIYFDYIYTFMSSVVRLDECVVFDEKFKAELAEIEAQHIRKLKKVTVPDEQTCFKQAIEKIKKQLHIVFLFSDLMSYKETFQIFPQLEYLCEVMFLDDISSQGYRDTAEFFLRRSNISSDLINEDQVLSKCLCKVHVDMMELTLTSFYSQKMKQNITWEDGPAYGRQQFVFPDKEKMTGNVFAGSGGFTVSDNEFRQTLFNTPIELGFMGKHRFAMFLEVFRFLYDLLNMHMQVRHAYYETFKAKSQQFLDFYQEVKSGKQWLQDDQSTKKLTYARKLKEIEDKERELKEKEESIGIKEAEIEEYKEELEIAQNEIDEVIKEKDFKLTQYLDKIMQVHKNDFDYFLVNDSFPEVEQDLLNILAVVEQVNKPKMERIEYQKTHFDLLFYHDHKDDLQNMLDNRRRMQFTDEQQTYLYENLNAFLKRRPYTTYNDHANDRKNGPPKGQLLLSHLYDYFRELFHKLNVRNTMATAYFRIQELKMQIDSNIFSVNYAKQSIVSGEQSLDIDRKQMDEMKSIAHKLSRQIEEAQISHMRTEAIEEHILVYTDRIKKRLDSLDSRVETVLGDSILLAASVVYLGPFAPEERERFRDNIRSFLNQSWKLEFNFLWKPMKANKRDAKPHRNIFWHVLKDIGLKELLSIDNMPGVLSPNDLAENLFTILFAPSMPVICDPTGQMQEFVKRTFMQNLKNVNISGADIFANEKLENVIKFGRMACVNDLTCMRKMSSGLSQDHPLMKRLSTTLFNGFDFHDFRTAQLKKAVTIQTFFTHQGSINKRVPCFDLKLENISLYQVQVYQPRYDFQLNAEFLQNATFLSAAPSHQSDSVLDNNPAIVQLKEIFMRNFLIDTTEFEDVKAKLRQINERMRSLESNFENSFLLASSETLKKLVDYKQLMEAVLAVNDEKKSKKFYMKRYEQIMDSINLLNEVARIIYQIFMALKQTSKIMTETTYSWCQFARIVDKIIANVISRAKIDQGGRASAFSSKASQDDDQETTKQSSMELEITQDFFTKEALPKIHKVMMSNVKIESKSFFNLVLSLRLALLYGSITIEEYQIILNQLIKLKDFWRWRDPSHSFVNMNDIVDKNLVKDIRAICFKLFDEKLARRVFDHINTTLSSPKPVTNQQLSVILQTQIKVDKIKFGLTPVQMIILGFLCPDHEFQGQMLRFMYEQMQSTFEFQEDLLGFKPFIKAADWSMPVALFCAPNINPVNLVLSIAKHYGIPLSILRTDPVSTAAQAVEELENAELRDLINSQLIDLANLRYDQKEQQDQARFDNLAHRIILEPQSNQVIAKQNWRALKERNVKMDDTSFVREINIENAEDEPVEAICKAAIEGTWVLICPVQFPQYYNKLTQKLEEIKEQISPHFRLIFDFQGFTQNEIPDSIPSEEAVTIHIDSSNIDKLPNFGDIWHRILDDTFLDLLMHQQVGQNPIRNVEFRESQTKAEDLIRTRNMKYIYEESVNDPALTAQFREYLKIQRAEFQQKLEKQQDETKRELAEQKRLDEEEERERLLLEEVKEEEDQAFSQQTELKNYENLMQGTEVTESIQRVHFEEDFKNERDSENKTAGNIPVVTSEGEISKSAIADQKPGQPSAPLIQEHDILVEHPSPLKRQKTMTQEQTENFFEEDKDQQERDRRVSSPGVNPNRRRTMIAVQPTAKPDENGFMVVGTGYPKDARQDSKNKSARQRQ